MIRTLLLLLLSLSPLPAAADCIPIARLHYEGGGDWYSNRSSIPNLARFVSTHTTVDLCTAPEPAIRLTDAELFSYPYLFMTGHGRVHFSEREAVRLREYLSAGGFLHIDDNFGLDESLRQELARIFPDAPLVELPPSHAIFAAPFPFAEGLPKIHEHHGGPPHAYGLYLNGRLALFYSFNTDLSDGWEDPRVHGDPEELRRAALRMGANIVVHAFTR